MPRETIGYYEPVTMNDVEGKSADWLKLALEVATADAADVSRMLEELQSDTNQGVSSPEIGETLGELDERLEWLIGLVRMIKIARYDQDISSIRAIEDVHTDKL